MGVRAAFDVVQQFPSGRSRVQMLYTEPRAQMRLESQPQLSPGCLVLDQRSPVWDGPKQRLGDSLLCFPTLLNEKHAPAIGRLPGKDCVGFRKTSENECADVRDRIITGILNIIWKWEILPWSPMYSKIICWDLRLCPFECVVLWTLLASSVSSLAVWTGEAVTDQAFS